MPWILRAILSLVPGSIWILIRTVPGFLEWKAKAGQRYSETTLWTVISSEMMTKIPPFAVTALLTYCLVMQIWRRRSSPGDESRCRKCDYILRGLTKPRCPECGERI